MDVWYLRASRGPAADRRPVLFLIHGGAWRGGEARCSPQVPWFFETKILEKNENETGIIQWDPFWRDETMLLVNMGLVLRVSFLRIVPW